MPTRLRWIAYVIAPLALVLGVALQRYNVHVHDQSAWAGGGFGMFSTVDIADGRARRAYVLTDRGPALVVDGPLGTLPREAYTQPRPERLAEAAGALAAQEWGIYGPESYRALWPALPDLLQTYFRSSPAWMQFLNDTTASADAGELYPPLLAFRPRNAPAGVAPLAVRVEGVRTEVWKSFFDSPNDRLGWELLAEASAPAAPASSPR